MIKDGHYVSRENVDFCNFINEQTSHIKSKIKEHADLFYPFKTILVISGETIVITFIDGLPQILNYHDTEVDYDNLTYEKLKEDIDDGVCVYVHVFQLSLYQISRLYIIFDDFDVKKKPQLEYQKLRVSSNGDTVILKNGVEVSRNF